jgi:hypothetical protein
VSPQRRLACHVVAPPRSAPRPREVQRATPPTPMGWATRWFARRTLWVGAASTISATRPRLTAVVLRAAAVGATPPRSLRHERLVFVLFVTHLLVPDRLLLEAELTPMILGS